MKYLKNVILLSAISLVANSVIAQCSGVVPPFTLGNDTTICVGTSLSLSPGANYDTYAWSTGSTAASINVGQAGTYSVEVGIVGANIITNGGFESGNTGFTTDYIYGTGGSWGLLSSAGQYAVSTSPSLTHNNFSSCGDHTSGTGNMLVANGSGTPNTNVWCQNVVVSPNTDYLFSAWITNALNETNVANLQFYVDGVAIGSVFSTSSNACNWQNYSDVWNSGISTNVNICIVNQNTTNGGNDFAIDDISFAPLCYDSDTVVVTTNPAPFITIDAATPICAGGTATLNATSVTPGLTYTWMPGSISGQTVTVNPTSSTSYPVTAVSNLGCVSNLQFTSVIVSPSPSVSLSVLDDTVCLGENAVLTATTTSAVSYTWQGSSNTTQALTDAPTTTSQYSVTVTSNNGCQSSDSLIVTVIQPVTVGISGTAIFCTDESTQLTVTGSSPGMNFVWLPSNSTATSETVTSANAGWMYVEGSLENCPAAVDSIFTEEIETPVINPISDVVICPGQDVEVTVFSSVPNSIFTWAPFNQNGGTQVFSADETTTYFVSAQNGNCVSDAVSFTIETSLICDLEIPNVFTPNGDQLNDHFSLISSQGLESVECIILNRWGNSIAEFYTPNFQWNGRNKAGEEVDAGTYFYKVSAITIAGDLLEKQGFVQVLR